MSFSFLTAVTLFLGAYIFSSSKIIWMMATLGLSVITNLGFMLLLEFLTRTQKCKICLLFTIIVNDVIPFTKVYLGDCVLCTLSVF